MTDSRQQTCSLNELLAVFISREIADHEGVGVGRNLSVPLAGVLLAHFHHAPNLKFGFGHVMTNLADRPKVDFSRLDWRQEARWAESHRPEDRTMLSLKHLRDSVFFIGGIQVDRFGNSNMIGVGRDYNLLDFRGPGAIGTTTFGSYVNRYYLILNSHTPRVLVRECDFISCVGFGRGGGNARRELGLPGGGPRYCITPLCVMDFDEETKHLRLKHLHPGVTVDQVKANTGFELIIPEAVTATPAPTGAELDILRTRVDPRGLLQRGGN